MMQVAHLKQAAKIELHNTSFNPSLVQVIPALAQATEDKAIKSGELTKTQSFNRLLEAYGDCV